MDLIERSALLKDLEDLKKSPWYNIGNPFIQQGMRECMDMIETQCIKKAPTVEIDEDMVIEYCRRRCFVIMTAELFADWFMNKRIEEAYDGSD